MKSFRFIHTGNIHFDSPLKGLSGQQGAAAERIRTATRAALDNLVSQAIEFPTAVADQLGISYRATQQIVDSFVAFAGTMGSSEGMLPLKLTAERGKGPELPDLRRFDQDEDEEEGIAAAIRELEAKGVRLRDQAILCWREKMSSDFSAIVS